MDRASGVGRYFAFLPPGGDKLTSLVFIALQTPTNTHTQSIRHSVFILYMCLNQFIHNVVIILTYLNIYRKQAQTHEHTHIPSRHLYLITRLFEFTNKFIRAQKHTHTNTARFQGAWTVFFIFKSFTAIASLSILSKIIFKRKLQFVKLVFSKFKKIMETLNGLLYTINSSDCFLLPTNLVMNCCI